MVSYGELITFGIIVLVFYIAYKVTHRNKPSEYHLLRNHFQKATHPNLNIIGFGDFYITYEYNGKPTIEYFNSMRTFRKRLEEIKTESSISNLSHGVMAYQEWKKWK